MSETAIPVAVSSYGSIEVEWKADATYSETTFTRYALTNSGNDFLFPLSWNYVDVYSASNQFWSMMTRTVVVHADNISFGVGRSASQKVGGSMSISTDNNRCVPIRIYGLNPL